MIIRHFEHIEIETKPKPELKDRPWEYSNCDMIIADGFVTVLTKGEKQSVRIFPIGDVLAIGGWTKQGRHFNVQL